MAKMTRTRVVFHANWGKYPYHVERYVRTYFWIFEDWTRLDIFTSESEAISYAKRYVENHRTLPDHGAVLSVHDEQDLVIDKLKGLR